MLIDFNNKYFTLAAIIFGIYIFQSYKTSHPSSNISPSSLNVKETSRYIIELDAQKDDKDRTFVEKIIYNYALKKQAEMPTKQELKPNVTFEEPYLEKISVLTGDNVTFKLRKDGVPWQDVEATKVNVGEGLIRKEFEEALIGMKLNEVKEVVYKHQNERIVKYEIRVTSILPRSRDRK